MQSRLILVDGSSYIYRAFHALPPLTNSQQEPSGAIYGVVAMLKKLKQESVCTDRIIVVLDSPTPTFRHELYPEYKANRLKMPEELKSQMPHIQTIISAMGFSLILHPGVEADDIIGTLAQQAQKIGIHTEISTNDKDFAQLVNDKVCLVNNMTGLRLGREEVLERYGVYPEQMIDYLSLMGDASDNVPGIPMVGPKTAAKWLAEYKTLDTLLENAEQIKGKVGESLRTHQQKALLAKELIAIKQDVPLKEDLESLLENPPQSDMSTLIQWFKRLEFKQWAYELQEKISTEQSHHDFKKHELILEKEQLDQWLLDIQKAEYLVIDLETTDLNTLDAKIVGIALGVSLDKVAYIPLQHDYIDAPKQLNREEVLNALKPHLQNPELKKIGHHLKYELGVLANYNIALKGIYADTLLEAYLIDSIRKGNDLDSLAWDYLNYKTITFEEVAGKGKKALSFNQIAIEVAAPYAAEDVSVCLALHQLFEPKLKEAERLKLRDDIEMPLVPVLSRMERLGVHINTTLLHQQSQELQTRLTQLEEKTYQLAGETFNLGSPKQLQVILYDKHHLPVLSKTEKGQPSTSEKALQLLSSQHPLPELILEYRTLSKLKSTYTEALPKQVHPKTGRVHTAYHQAVVATGRLSSSNPNLQNIPIRTEEGRKVRKAFEAAAGYKILAADYSQIELRIMAHFSKDKTLLAAFEKEQDIHSATAAVLFEVPVEKVSQEQRRRAKAVNFGLMYGMSAFGLAAQLQITQEVAQNIMDQYFERYPGVRQYMEKTRELAHKQGYVTTLFGRQLPLPLIRSKNKHHQKGAERAAINAPLQGTAADIIKCAMISIEAELRNRSIDAKMVMQVHDELVFEVKEEVLEVAHACIEEGMQNAAELAVPLRVTVGIGNNWDEAH